MLNAGKLMIANQAGTCRKYVKLSCICKTQCVLLLFFVMECSLVYLVCKNVSKEPSTSFICTLLPLMWKKHVPPEQLCLYHIETHGIKSHKTKSFFFPLFYYV